MSWKGGEVLDAYLQFLKAQPLLSSALQVMVLGMVGEWLAIRIRRGRWAGFGPGRTVLKLLVWAFLGVTFKYAFAGFFGFVDALVHKGFWFAAAGEPGLARALSVSLFTNLLFGPMMMLFHRVTDNLIEGNRMNWASLQQAWLTLVWFWIPAHTLTFSVSEHLQVGLAALWAVALGIILGFFARKKA